MAGAVWLELELKLLFVQLKGIAVLQPVFRTRPRSCGAWLEPTVQGLSWTFSLILRTLGLGLGSTYDITIAYRCGRGQGGISKETGAHCPCLAPSSSLLPFLGFSLPSFLLPSSPHPTFSCSVVQPGTPPPVLQGRRELLSPQD